MASPGLEYGWLHRLGLILGLLSALVILSAAIWLAVALDGLAGAPPSGDEVWPFLTLGLTVAAVLVLRGRVDTALAGLLTVTALALGAHLIAVSLSNNVLIRWSVTAVPGAVAMVVPIAAALMGRFRAFDRGLSWAGLATLLAAIGVQGLLFTRGPGNVLDWAFYTLAVMFLLVVYPLVHCAFRRPAPY